MEDKEYNYCLRCGKKLKSKASRLRGYGITCYEKLKFSVSIKPLISIGECDMSRKLSEAKKQKYLDRLNKVRMKVNMNEVQYNSKIISESEYQAVCDEILTEVDTLEKEILKGGSNE